jgi:signal transduction histidine kinase
MLAPYRSIRTMTLLMLSLVVMSLLALLAAIIQRGRVLASNYGFREAVKARQDTLAIVSHDLRAPLNNVLLCANMISSQTDALQLDRLTSIIKRSTGQMNKLITDLLDVSEMERGRLSIERAPCLIPTLLDAVIDTFAEEAKSKHIELVASSPPSAPIIDVDPHRIVQVLSNLVGNALKFTPAKGRVSVDVVVLPREVRFEIRDTGPGIPERELPFVFEQFWRAKASKKGGKGLGLYIAKMIVERHGGRIWAESRKGLGSAFFFTIPY